MFKVPDVTLHLGENNWVQHIVRSILITLLAWGLSHFVIYDLESITTFASSEKKGDFHISDIYNAIANHRNVSQATPYVTVVAVDDCSRQDVMDVLDIISEYQPSVIGLDIFFRVPNNDSAQIINLFKGTPNLVLPTILRKQNNGDYERIVYSFVEQSLEANYGYVNLNASSVVDVVRDFTPSQHIVNGDTMWQISAEMAQIAYPEKFNVLQQRNNPTEIIQFSSISIPIVSAQEILYGDDDAYLTRYLTNRAVLVGDINNINDMYSTPLNELMPGITIHAHTLHTILSESYTSISPTWLNWLIALIICFLFLFINIKVRDKWSLVGNMIMRVLQIALMFSLVFIGSYWYSSHLQYIDFSPIILMIGFSSLASDIYDGLYAIYIKIIITKTQKQ